jgi:hypothetical protein
MFNLSHPSDISVSITIVCIEYCGYIIISCIRGRGLRREGPSVATPLPIATGLRAELFRPLAGIASESSHYKHGLISLSHRSSFVSPNVVEESQAPGSGLPDRFERKRQNLVRNDLAG